MCLFNANSLPLLAFKVPTLFIFISKSYCVQFDFSLLDRKHVLMVEKAVKWSQELIKPICLKTLKALSFLDATHTCSWY